MKISYHPLAGSRSHILAELLAHRKDNPNYRVIDLGAVAGQGWASAVTDLVIDIDADSNDPKALALDICQPETWQHLFDLVDEQGLFDYAICTHTLEDLYDPVLALRYLPRIARAGVISMPTVRTELCRIDDPHYLGFVHHRWLFDQVDGEMILVPKLAVLEAMINGSGEYLESQGEIVYEWEGKIPYRMFMDGYLGPSPIEVLESLAEFVAPRIV